MKEFSARSGPRAPIYEQPDILVNAPQYNNSDASELVSLAAAGDAGAQRSLVEQLSRRVRSIALSILGNAADADDATQAIFMEVLQSLDTYKGGRFLPWVDRIAVRTAARHARQRRVRGTHDATIDIEHLAAEPSATTERRVPRPIVDYLAELPETRRVALVLRHVMGYSVEEIAGLTEVSPSTVKDRLLHAREQLRKTLRRELSIIPAGRRRDHD